VVATNASLNKGQVNRVATLACTGMARTISPPHTSFDGDAVFALSLGSIQASLDQVGVLAAECVARATVRAVQEAWSVGGVPATRDL
jgi:L-aminopeptidase/D-esterase-like protein